MPTLKGQRVTRWSRRAALALLVAVLGVFGWVFEGLAQEGSLTAAGDSELPPAEGSGSDEPGETLPSPPFAVAEALARADFDEAARKEVARVLKLDPTLIDRVPPGLDPLVGGQLDGWNRQRKAILTALGELTEVGLVAVLVVGGLLLLVVRRFRDPRLDVQPFTRGGEEAPESGFEAMFEAWFRRWTREGATQDLQLVTGPIQPLALEPLLAAYPKSSPFVAALKSLPNWTRRNWKLSGYLHEAGGRGPGVTVTLVEGRRLLMAETLWQQDFEPPFRPAQRASPEVWDELAQHASIRVAFEMVESSGISTTRSQGFGTDRWKAFALFRSGVRYHLHLADPASAKYLYGAALKVDPEFQSAKTNLARLWRRRFPGMARALVEEVETPSKDRAHLSPAEQNEATRHFVHALVQLEAALATSSENERRQLLESSRREAAKLLARVRGDRALEGTYEPIGLDIELRLKEKLDGGLRGKLDRADFLMPPSLYNLACVHATAAELDPGDADRAAKALKNLELALDLNPAYLHDCLEDASFRWLRAARRREFSEIVRRARSTLMRGRGQRQDQLKRARSARRSPPPSPPALPLG